MIRQRHRVTASLYLLSDSIFTALAFLAAWRLRFESGLLPVPKDVPAFSRYVEILPLAMVVWSLVFYFHGLYQVRRNRGRTDEALTILLACALATVLLSVFVAWYRPEREPGSLEYFTYSRGFLALFALLAPIAIILGRLALRSALRRGRFGGLNRQRILIVGAGALGKETALKLLNHSQFGLEVVGFLEDDPGKASRNQAGVPVLGQLQDINRVLAEHSIDQVMISLPLEAHKKMLRLLRSISHECVEVKLVPDILQYATLSATIEDLDGTPVINLSQVPLQGWNTLLKRGVDIAVAVVGMILLAPIFPIIAAAIWWNDRGPIFYSQERMGLDGKCFQILKFRSMRTDAESTTGPVWAIKDDPRRTWLGSMMRQWSIDELPQLWNVLMGDMSIIGPRPERPAFVNEFKHRIPQYMLRHRVKSGMTGWAQVHGWRGNTSIKKRIDYDLYYIQNWSLKLDFKILWMTFRHGVWYNAY